MQPQTVVCSRSMWIVTRSIWRTTWALGCRAALTSQCTRLCFAEVPPSDIAANHLVPAGHSIASRSHCRSSALWLSVPHRQPWTSSQTCAYSRRGYGIGPAYPGSAPPGGHGIVVAGLPPLSQAQASHTASDVDGPRQLSQSVAVGGSHLAKVCDRSAGRPQILHGAGFFAGAKPVSSGRPAISCRMRAGVVICRALPPGRRRPPDRA